MKNVEYNALLKMHLCGLKAKYFPRTVYSKTRNFLFKQLELSEGTSRALRILNKGREYLLPKPEEDLDAESAEEHSDLPEQSSESSSDDSSSETSESSCESYNVDEDESSEELSSVEETETASMVERAPTTSDEVPSNLAVVLGEGISQISESDYQTALASTSSADDVVNTVQGYDNIEDDMQQYVNDNCSGKWRFNSKYLRKIHIVVSEGKYKKKKCCLYCPFEDIKDATMVAKLHRHLQSFHQRELRVSNLRRINQEIEELEGSKEIATTERDLRKLHKEKDQTYRLITYEGQYKYKIAVFKKCIERNRFTDKLIVVRDPTETENPTADNYAPCPDCLGFFMRKTMYRHKLDCPAVTKSSHKEGKNKNIKAAIFALMLEIKANHNTPFQEFLYNNLRNDPVAELIRNDPLIKYVGEYYFNKRKSDEGYNQIRDRMRIMAKLVLQLECSYLIELIRPDMWSRVKEAVSKNFAKSYQVKMGSILKTAAAFLQNQAFVWEKKEISQQAKQFQKIIDTEWAQISAPAKYE